jgi:hypothetical protein
MEWVAHIMTALGPATMTLDSAPCALEKEVQYASKANGGRGTIPSKDGSDRASDGRIRRRAVLEKVSEDPRGAAVALWG